MSYLFPSFHVVTKEGAGNRKLIHSQLSGGEHILGLNTTVPSPRFYHVNHGTRRYLGYGGLLRGRDPEVQGLSRQADGAGGGRREAVHTLGLPVQHVGYLATPMEDRHRDVSSHIQHTRT